MSQPFLAEIRMFGFNYPPSGWAQCNGQILPINQNQALYSLLGTTYGGDGETSFGLPELRGRIPVHVDSGGFSLGQKGGAETHILTVPELPAHTHSMPNASNDTADSPAAAGKVLARSVGNVPGWADASTGTMNATAVEEEGGGQSHENRQPYLAVNFCIALIGVFPSES